MQKYKILKYTLGNIACTALTIIAIVFTIEIVTEKSWRSWLIGTKIEEAQKPLHQVQDTVHDLEKYVRGLEETFQQNAGHVSVNELMIKQQKIMWLTMVLSQKFREGLPYEEEWKLLLPLLPATILHHPSILELSRHSSKGIMTKEKLKYLLLPQYKPVEFIEENTAPKKWWDHLKDWVTIEKIPVHGNNHHQAVTDLDLPALQKYISQTPAAVWMNIPIEEYINSQRSIQQFYTLLTPYILESKAVPEAKK